MPVNGRLTSLLMEEAPLCEIETRSIGRHFDCLLYEYVNDPDVRDRLSRAKGYCNRHAHRLVTCGDGLGASILYRDQVAQFLDRLNRRHACSAPFSIRRRPGARDRATRCPACASQAECRDRQADTLLRWMDDREMRAALETSPGLCVPHLTLVLSRARTPGVRNEMIRIHSGKYAQLACDLSEYVRRQDYRFRGLPAGREKDAWRRAVCMMAGMKDVF